MENWMMLHWLLNPGIMVNELILGQRVPKISLEEKTTDKQWFERSIVPCPHCETLHDGRTWSSVNGTAFKNWFGLYCNTCGNIIPCLTNVFSLIILVITFPIWGWFKNALKNNWLKKQPQRFIDINLETTTSPLQKISWLKIGLIWGAFMFLIFMVMLYLDGSEIPLIMILLVVVISAIGGLIFGYLMKIIFKATIKIRNIFSK
ncbi:hypothetical protein [Sphingobacterium sp. 1.A.5]|uniref:hypothetical protein n=1 Tax=Sphingobacterium sp. 1.A.5 TaxID=2044604 RepID=UPI001C55802A|nr:hypothetical protein [Sphingobacterium sp. 1.A.5]